MSRSSASCCAGPNRANVLDGREGWRAVSLRTDGGHHETWTFRGDGAAGGLTVPSPDELQAALAGIDDPQLRQQVAPDGSYDAADCVVHIGQMDPVPVGQQEALDNASDAWRRGLARELGGETEANQMIGSSVNMLQPTPAPLRQAAVAWCVDNAPRG